MGADLWAAMAIRLQFRPEAGSHIQMSNLQPTADAVGYYLVPLRG